jgi:hypothetical protein
MRPVEKITVKRIDSVFGSPTIMKGYNAKTQGRIFARKWHRFRRPCVIGLDASRFDQHVSVEALKWEHRMEVATLHPKDDRQLFAKLLSHQLRNTCVGYFPDGKVRYTTRGTRMSGDMNTSIGNCLIMCGLIYEYLSSKDLLKHVEVANNGDDSVLITEEKYETLITTGLEEFFLRYGFTMKVEPTEYILEKLVFCQTQPINLGTSWIMARQPEVALCKDLTTFKPVPNREAFDKLRGAIGDCGAALSSGVPIMQSFYQYLKRNAGMKRMKDDGEVSGMKFLAEGLHESIVDISPEARASFYFAFNILPELQIEIEKIYNSSMGPIFKNITPVHEYKAINFDIRANLLSYEL